MLKYAYGYETIIKDKIPLEMSMQFAASVSESWNLQVINLNGNTESEINFYEIECRFSRSLNFTINIGLGYLVF
jgi:hypothetical protein